MRILLTGANGYIGTRLLSALLEKGHQVLILARNPDTIKIPEGYTPNVTIKQGDLLQPQTLKFADSPIDAAYYLVHSMAQSKDFEELEKQSAQNFVQLVNETECQQIIYLTGLISTHNPSKHLRSRLHVEKILTTAHAPLTALRAGIIIGSGSASFEIIRDLTEKLPVMVAPKWIDRKCQPIAISDVIYYLVHVLGNPACYGDHFDIGGPDILTYKEMLLQYAKIRGLKRRIISVPVLTPRLSSYWLVLVTTTNYYLARNLIDSVKNDAICQEHRIKELIPLECLRYEESVKRALDRIAQDHVPSSWKNSWSSSHSGPMDPKRGEVPEHGTISMSAKRKFSEDPDTVFTRIQQIGDDRGWYFMNWAWHLRAFIDTLLGGAGFRKGRRSQKELKVGDTVDFWRVLHIDTKERRLLLYAEMKLPGEAWLEFEIYPKETQHELCLRAIFRPKGNGGRVYWYLFYPIHKILFPGMLKRLISQQR